MMQISLRTATKEDIKEIFELIRELAIYEKAEHEFTLTEEQLIMDGFGEYPLFHILLAEFENNVVGMSFWFYSYSTWKGKCMYLEDLIVKKEFRGKGVGKILFDATIKEAYKTNAQRLMWQVLDWNTPAIDFYKSFGASIEEEWYNGRMTRPQLENYMKSQGNEGI